MDDPIPIEFGTGSHPGLYGPDNGPRHINVRMGMAPESKSQTPYYSYWGLDSFATVPNVVTGCRCLIKVGPSLLSLLGNQLIKFDSSGSYTALGGIPGDNKVIAARNQASPLPHVVFVSDGIRYEWTGGLLQLLDDPDLPSPNSATFINQRIVYGIPDGRFFWSDVGSASSVDGLSFAEAEADPDDGVRVINHRGDLWYLGTETQQIFRDTGQTINTFAPIAGGYTRMGCAAAHTVAALGDELIWVSDKGSVVLAEGYQPQPISSEAVQASIAAVDDKTELTGAAYHFRGLGFYELSAPGIDGWTWVFNRNTKTWFEARSNGLTRRRTQMVAAFGDKILMGDHETGDIYALSASTFTENGEAMVWELQSPPWHAYPNRVSVYRLYLDLVTGAGASLSTADKVMIDWSDDGGRTWSDEIVRRLGVKGEYSETVEVSGLGATSRQGRIWRTRVSSAGPRALLGAKTEANKIGT